MKIDIRVLILSLLLHLSFYGLMSLVTSQPLQIANEVVEIIIDDRNSPERVRGYVPKLDIHAQEDNNNKATVLADQRMRFKQQTIARQKGVAQNSSTSRGNDQQQIEQKDLDLTNKGFMPLEKNPTVNRTSSIHLNLPHIQDGSFTFLNADFSTYASFFNRIGPNIISHWGSNVREFAYFPQVREQIVLKDRWLTRIEVILDKKGYLKDVIVVNSSGLTELDHAVVDAIKTSAPFLNPPTGMVEADGFVHIHGQFSVFTRNPRLAN